ncbi:MAG: DMT family transporter [Alphaproteobacteria bacterium]|nr:DMT family transporter [Alphaproteobacteria bacterium]
MSHKPLDATAILLMLVLCASWGAQQIAVKLALPEMAPVAQAAFRSAVALGLVGVWTLLRGRQPPLIPAAIVPGIWAGLLFAAEFALLYIALGLTDAARVVVFLYTAPFWVALGSLLVMRSDRLPASRWAGIALAFAGVVLAIGPAETNTSPTAWIGDLLALAAGALWGGNTLVVKATPLARESTERVVLYQLLVSALAMGAVSLALGEHWSLPTSLPAVLSVAYQCVWVATVTLLGWFGLVARYSATRLSVFTFLTPLIGAGLGWALLGESLSPLFLAALGLVAAGIVLVSWPSSAAPSDHA